MYSLNHVISSQVIDNKLNSVTHHHARTKLLKFKVSSYLKTKSDEAKQLKEVFTSNNIKQLLRLFISIITGIYQVLIATMLSVVVPQCYLTSTNEKKLFTLMDHFNMKLLSRFQIFVLLINIITSIAFIFVYYIEAKREVWMVNSFDYDETQNEYHLHEYKGLYPDLIAQLGKYNSIYHQAYYLMKYLNLSNLILSGLLIYIYYYDHRTITAYLSNGLICYQKVKSGVKLAKIAKSKELAISTYTNKNLSFNIIDPRHIDV